MRNCREYRVFACAKVYLRERKRGGSCGKREREKETKRREDV